jgi:DNA-directed RNA polymerase specialized sigma24 family protein
MTPSSFMTEPATKPGLLELALTFNKISLASFGGGLSAWARRLIVEEKKWLDDEEFLSALTLSRVLPGANQMNFAVYVGNRFHTDGTYADSLKSHPEQHSRLEFDEFRAALTKLPPHQREALILVGASGFSCEEAAAICDCAVGTVKSRVHRARIRLSKLLSINGADDYGPDHTTRGTLSAGGRS